MITVNNNQKLITYKELTKQGIIVAKELNKKIESIPSTMEPIEINQKKKYRRIYE